MTTVSWGAGAHNPDVTTSRCAIADVKTTDSRVSGVGPETPIQNSFDKSCDLSSIAIMQVTQPLGSRPGQDPGTVAGPGAPARSGVVERLALILDGLLRDVEAELRRRWYLGPLLLLLGPEFRRMRTSFDALLAELSKLDLQRLLLDAVSEPPGVAAMEPRRQCGRIPPTAPTTPPVLPIARQNGGTFSQPTSQSPSLPLSSAKAEDQRLTSVQQGRRPARSFHRTGDMQTHHTASKELAGSDWRIAVFREGVAPLLLRDSIVTIS